MTPQELATWEDEGGALEREPESLVNDALGAVLGVGWHEAGTPSPNPWRSRCDYGGCRKTAQVMLITLDHEEDRIAERRPMCRKHADEYVAVVSPRMLKRERPVEMVIGRLR